MISALFVDRPRLAIVISAVLTIAGLLSLYVIPIAQYPDIVPPQVSVTTTYPGANAAVVDATVAQPIEAQVSRIDYRLRSALAENDLSPFFEARRPIGNKEMPSALIPGVGFGRRADHLRHSGTRHQHTLGEHWFGATSCFLLGSHAMQHGTVASGS